MSIEVTTAKLAIRREVRANLKRIPVDQRAAASKSARDVIEGQAVWKAAGVVLAYAPLPEELDIWPLIPDAIAKGKIVCLPRFDAAAGRYVACRVQNLTEDLVRGRFGVLEPATSCAAFVLNPLDLILVPGIAFDLHGRRLGRGKGFYDRLLADTRGFRCGVAFDEQILTEIPVEPHDVSIDCILTPTRWIKPKRGGSE